MITIRTHHKTGTVWMDRVFRGIADILGVEYCQLRGREVPKADIYHVIGSSLPPQLVGADFRGLHVIRDPRDVVISGMHYHRHSKESWLHDPSPEYGGVSYQDALNRLDVDEQIFFEIRGAGNSTTREMLAWNYNDDRFFEARYEDLIESPGVALFERILGFLHIYGEQAERSLERFRVNSLSSRDYSSPNDPHVRSGRPRQWQRAFRKRHGEYFVEILGDCLVRLGYEWDNGWIDRLPD